MGVAGRERKKRERKERMNMNGLRGLCIQASNTRSRKGDKVLGLETDDGLTWGLALKFLPHLLPGIFAQTGHVGV